MGGVRNQGSSRTRSVKVTVPWPVQRHRFDGGKWLRYTTTNTLVISEASKYVSECECDEGIENDSDCEEWIDENQQDDDQINVFDLFDEEEDL